MQTDDVAPQSIVHTQNIQRPSNSVRPIHRHRPDVVHGNCDLPSSRTCSIPPFALSQAPPLCSTSPPFFARQNFPPLCGFSKFPSFPIPVLALYFVLATWVQPSHPASPRPSSVSGVNLVLTHRLLSFLPLSAAVLYCTVLYANFDAMAVGTNSLTCGFNWQCTADAIGYAVMITARLDFLPSPHSLPRFGSTPAGRPYTVDPYSVTSDDHTYTHTWYHKQCHLRYFVYHTACPLHIPIIVGVGKERCTLIGPS